MNSWRAGYTPWPMVLMVFALGGAAVGQPYPVKAVRIIVPFPAGTGADIVARHFTPKLAQILGQQFIVDNRAGAAGNIGAEAAARAAPDGYTLLMASASVAVGQSVYKNLRFNLARDFESISLVGTAPFVLAVHPSLPVRSARDLVALAKSRPGQLTYASSGNGSSPHLTAEMLRMQAGVDLVHIPYKGSSPALVDLVAGQVSMIFANTASVLPLVNTGRLRALAVTGAKRSPIAPLLPTVAESGLPGFESATWWALLTPAGTPREIIDRINATSTKIGQMHEIRDAFAKQGVEPLGGTPRDAEAYIRNEIAKWSRVVAAAGVRAE